jgi:Cytochrome oxidase complex assembly protein 1
MNAQPNHVSNPQVESLGTIAVAARKGWFSRNWKWFVPILLIVFLVLPLAVLGTVFAAIRSSDVAKESFLRAQSNPVLVEKIGAPIDEGSLISGSINVSGASGDAEFVMPISGPRGRANVYVTARKTEGTWNYRQMIAAIEGSREKIDLLSSDRGSELQSNTPYSAAPNLEARPAVDSPTNPAGADLQTHAAENNTVAAVAPAPPSSAPPPNSSAAVSSDIIQSQDTNIPGVAGELIQCRRSDGVLSIKIRFHNTSGTYVRFLVATNGSYDKFYVAAASKKYFILKDSDGAYLAPGGDYSCGDPGVCEKLQAGQSNTWWAKFPAPPASVTKVDVFTTIAPPFEDIPITDK